ncbi:MAG: response regulator [Methanospirillaceae archaeon]|nr:response regulator [Methanospirillaceae archaeon]
MATILVVDDEAIITMQLEERLSTLGYAVVGMAASGEDAVRKAQQLHPDIVLMDIVMPGKMNGIEAAEIIITDLQIPVIFVTSYADDLIITKAKQVQPYGYIVKPFNELEIKAAIEIALFRKKIKDSGKTGRTTNHFGHQLQDGTGNEGSSTGSDDFSGLKTILISDICSDLILLIYSDESVKEMVFTFAIQEALQKGIQTLFVYAHSRILPRFFPERRDKKLISLRIKDESLPASIPFLEQYLPAGKETSSPLPVQVLLDIPAHASEQDCITVTEYICSYRTKTPSVSGIIALQVTAHENHLVQELADKIPRVIVSVGADTALSFAHHSFSSRSVFVVPQETIDEVVKKSLEPVVLSLLTRPLSGYDIVHEIHNRYRVLVPQARIYTLLYQLEQDGYLTMKMSGKSKRYSPTEEGQNYIRKKLDEFRFIFQHVLDGAPGMSAEEKKDLS